MEKKIEDYLHLYLGCDCSYKKIDMQGNEWHCPFISTLTGILIHESLNGTCKVIKPILRPLSDMTEEEKYLDFEKFLNVPKFNEETNAERVMWLLSKHFDLFGLIESGLAIDAATISTSNQK